MSWLVKTSTLADGNMSLRYGAQTAVLENRRQFLHRLGLSAERCVVMASDHQDIVTVLNELSAVGIGHNTSLPADTLITQTKNQPLLLTTADCLPISVFDPVTKTIGLMHLSRHTFVLGLIEKTTAALVELEVEMQNVEVTIGPHIHRQSYCFPLPLREEPEKLRPYIKKTATDASINLTQAAVDTLIAHGIQSTKITVSPIDTFTSPTHFSHVRSVKNSELEGRLATVVALTEKV